MLSAVTGFDQQLQARELGITKYMTKPTTPAKLVTAIREVLSPK
jgi:DNA-binding response OmpR family regulator